MEKPRGSRLCLKCLEALIPGTFGWTWSFGVCGTCQHFGITVEDEGPLALKAWRKQQREQPQLKLD